MLFETSLEAIAITDDQGSYLHANAATDELFGLAPTELLGRCLVEFIEPEFNIQSLWQTLQEQGRVRSHFPLVRADGARRMVEYAVTANFAPHHHLWVMRDITERQPAAAKVPELIQPGDRQDHELASDRRPSELNPENSPPQRTSLSSSSGVSGSCLEQIAHHIPGVIYQFHQRLDGTFHFPYASERIREIYGVSREEVCEDASKVFGLIHPEDLDRVSQLIQESAEHLTPWYCEYRVCLPTGKMLWLLGHATPQRELDGSTIWHGYIRDISEQKNREIALAESEAKFSTIFYTSPDPAWIATLAEGRCLNVNASLCELVEATSEQILGKTCIEFELWDNLADLHYFKQNLIQKGNIQNFEVVIRTFSKQAKTVLISAKVERLDGQDCVVGMMKDISDRKAAEIENCQTQNFLNSIIENIPNMVFVKDAKTLQFVRFNKAGEELLGYPREAFLGKSDYDFFLPEEAKFFIAKDQEVLTNGTVVDIPEEKIQTKHQGTRILHTRKIPILDELGNPKYLLGISEDITDRKQAEIQLKELSERLSFSLKSGGIGCWEWDVVQNTLVWDDRMYELYGVNKSSETRLAYEIWSQGLHPDDRETSEALIQQAVLGQAKFDPEFRVIHPDGSIHFIKAFGLVRYDAEGNPQKMIGVNFDITDRKEAERKLRQNEQKYHDILDAIADMVLVKGPQSRIVWANKAFRDYYALGNEQLTDMIDAPFNEPDYTLQYIRDDAYVFETGQSLEVEEPVTRYDGEVRMFNTIKSLIRNEAGEKILTVGVSRDMTDRKRQEQALRLIVEGTAAKTGEEFFQSCVQYLAQVLGVRYALIAEFIDSEKMTAKTLGFWVDKDFGENFIYSLKGAPCQNVYTQRDLCLYPNSVQALFPEDADLVALNAESYAGLPIIDSAGNLLGLLAVLDTKPMVQDLEMQAAILRIFATRAGAEIERIHAEAALRQSEIQLRQQAAELEITLKQLQSTQTQLIQAEKMSSLGQLVAGIAHEINNPVSFIYSNLNPANKYVNELVELIYLYQSHYPHPPQTITDFTDQIDFEYMVSDFSNLLTSMKTGATRISDIVTSLRTFSRLDEADCKEIDINHNIETTLIILRNRLERQTESPEVVLTKNYGDLPLVECYGGLLNQVFLNLLINALDAIDECRETLDPSQKSAYLGKLTIATSITANQKVLISIQDNGCGMGAEVKAKVFNPFFTTKPVGKGTGMGLATSYQIVTETHKGDLRCHSALGEGTTFEVEIPQRIWQNSAPLV